VAFTILLILSTMALPLARVRVQREKERRLRDALTEMRKAIDRYKDYADAGKLGQVDPETNGYPESLEVLVEGVEISDSGAAAGFGNMPGGGNFGQPAGQGNRSGRGGMGSNRGSGSNSGGFGSNRGGSGSSGFGQSNRGSSSSRGGFGSSRGGMGSSGGGMGSSGMGSSGIGSSGTGAFGTGERSGSDDEEQKIRFLRRIPVDPMTGTADWGMRSVGDSPDSMSWGGRNVFDVFSKSMDTALDGTRFSEW
jgi:type II secretory pathway pseudopilin PulG